MLSKQAQPCSSTHKQKHNTPASHHPGTPLPGRELQPPQQGHPALAKARGPLLPPLPVLVLLVLLQLVQHFQPLRLPPLLQPAVGTLTGSCWTMLGWGMSRAVVGCCSLAATAAAVRGCQGCLGRQCQQLVLQVARAQAAARVLW